MEQRPARRVRIDASDLLLEIISIVLAILLALAVNNWVENRRHQELVNQSLRDIHAELALNLSQIDEAGPFHRRILHGFNALLTKNGVSETLRYGQIGRTFQSSSPTGFHLMVPEDTAWTVAASSGAVQYMDHDMRTELTKTYASQRLVDQLQHAFINAILYTPPAGERNFYYVTAGAGQTLSDLVGLEGQMRKRYKKTLSELDAALR